MPKKDAILQDSAMERAVLAGITTHGAQTFFEVQDILSINDFYWPQNQQLFSIIAKMVEDDDAKQFDMPSMQAKAKVLGYEEFVFGGKYSEYLEAVISENASNKDNIIMIAIAIYKLSLSRKGYLAAKSVQDSLTKIKGDEPIEQIISSIEEPILNFTGNITSQGQGISCLSNGFAETMKVLAENPQDIVGLPTGFKHWDNAIGGGLRPATVNVVGARPKIGKSFFCLNVAKNVAENGIPVLYLDTELTGEQQLYRLTSLLSGVSINHIETGKFDAHEMESQAIWSTQEKMDKLKIDHFSVAGMAPHAIMSAARRWISKRVGLNEHGTANPCLIIYDYIKLMDDGQFKHNLQEFQLIGFLVTALHNFAVRYKMPILATVQLNRDGVEKEGGEVISGSDRVLWLCSNFSILKKKTQEELNEDPHINGTKKLLVTNTRNGPGMESGEYINIKDQLEVGRFLEGQTFSMATQSALENKPNEE